VVFEWIWSGHLFAGMDGWMGMDGEDLPRLWGPRTNHARSPSKCSQARGSIRPAFFCFTAWYEEKHYEKLGADTGADTAELTTLMTAFKTIQETLNL
jgi:hypothetical protein